MREVPVLIVGAGPVGLTTSILLSRMGVPTLLVERRSGISTLPRARGIMSRSVEIWSHFGLYPEMTDFSLSRDWCRSFLYLDTLAGDLIGAMPSNCMAPEAQQTATAYEFRCAAQDQIDAMLWRCAAGYPEAEIQFSTELLDIEQDDAGVMVTLGHEDGTTEPIRAAWLVAADGGRSPVRERLGIRMSGPPALGSFINTHFTADLGRWTAGREATLLWVLAHGNVGCFQPLDGQRRWMCQILFDPLIEPPEIWTASRVVRRLRDMIGDRDVDTVDIDLHSSYAYTVAAQVADRLRDRRALLVGDAAHRIPPAGGIGMNTGVQTAHNLAWKLAAVLKGQATDRLLDTFDSERREVASRACTYGQENLGHIRAIAGASSRHEQRAAIAASRQYGNWSGLDLGVHYEGSGAYLPDGRPAPMVAHPVVDYVPNATPGYRAPHLWLRRAEERFSATDLFERHFVLLTGRAGGPWIDAVRHCQQPAPVLAFEVSDSGDLRPESDFLGLYGINEDGAVLVRPDGHVAWRTARLVGRPGPTLHRALCAVLCRPAQ